MNHSNPERSSQPSLPANASAAVQSTRSEPGDLPLVTVIIAARPGQADVPAVTASRALDYPNGLLEIMVARGRHPAVQRNEAMEKATGSIIYFLDDDAQPLPGSLRHAVAHFGRAKVQMVGGPNLCPAAAPLLERLFALVLSSWLAFGPSRARYYPVGKARATSEKELILCNLLGRRQALLEAGGFDESLYPNEENALMDELAKRGGELIYDPQVLVYRRPRSTLGAFVKMVFRYGRGRAEQFRRHPSLGSAPNFVPPLFCLYLVMVPGLGRWSWWPLAGYGVALLLQAAMLMRQGGGWLSLAAIPLIFLTHVGYGIGFWCGLFTPLRSGRSSSGAEVLIEKVQAT